MHVSTFYSFKGGVGRTLALVNVAVELAKSGRKVLVVDFDLEAPGIDTFTEFSSSATQRGVVDFVNDYLTSGSPPDVRGYVYRAQHPSVKHMPGELWVMPAGQRGAAYGASLAHIDWQKLYDEREGFLLLEDLKSQWEQQLAPDYVLVDSRTGYTEVGGICTRQLPNLVIMLFVPNEQNLAGLQAIVNAIRAEPARAPGGPISIEFVASNVPTLDDEESILRRLLGRFQRSLSEAASRPAKAAGSAARFRMKMVERYDSLDLLDQAIFVLKRPKSRLARQYRQVMELLINDNLDDRQGVIEFLKRQLRPRDFSYRSPASVDARVAQILTRHPHDAEVLVWSGRYYHDKADTSTAIGLFQQALETHESTWTLPVSEVHLDLAESLLAEQQSEEASRQLHLALADMHLELNTLRRLIQVLHQADKRAAVPELSKLPLLASVDDNDVCLVAEAMAISPEWQRAAFDILSPRANALISAGSESDDPEDTNLVHEALLAGIGGRCFDRIQPLADHLVATGKLEISNVFNAAMAYWAVSGNPDPGLFARVIKIDAEQHPRFDDANYHQCLALACAIVENSPEAQKHLESARRLNAELQLHRFSCWRYYEVSPGEFREDLAELESFLSSGCPRPLFLR